MANLSISDLAKQMKADIDETVRQFVVNLGNSCINKSPIGMPETWNPPVWPKGYEPGHFINNWQHGLGSAPDSEIAGVDPGITKSTERIRDSVYASPAAGIHYIVNNVPYAALLEYGYEDGRQHSKQVPPQGMVGLTVIEADMHLRRAIASVK